MNSEPGEPIRLIVGLGNPGAQYRDTRHNAGYWLVERLARAHGVDFRPESRFFGETCRIRAGGHDCWLLKPSTFMNRSGQSVASLVHYYRIPTAQLLVAHDELDLAAGSVRLKRGGGHAGHNGLRDIISALGEREFWRLRIRMRRPMRPTSGCRTTALASSGVRTSGSFFIAGICWITALRFLPVFGSARPRAAPFTHGSGNATGLRVRGLVFTTGGRSRWQRAAAGNRHRSSGGSMEVVFP